MRVSNCTTVVALGTCSWLGRPPVSLTVCLSFGGAEERGGSSEGGGAAAQRLACSFHGLATWSVLPVWFIALENNAIIIMVVHGAHLRSCKPSLWVTVVTGRALRARNAYCGNWQCGRMRLKTGHLAQTARRGLGSPSG